MMERAEGDIAVLEEEDFRQICDMTMNFKEYLKTMNDDMDEQERAFQERLRLRDDM
jgi:hypothetical protein